MRRITGDLPRRLAPLLFGIGNIVYGVVGVLQPQRAPAYAFIPGSLKIWGVAFVILGTLILATMNTLPGAALTSVLAVMLWLGWATFTVEARWLDPRHVTLKAVVFTIWLALLHYLLSPYNRKPRT